ncbi:response regulator transcription factor [Bacillus pseudomycoides]|uniref:response regulator transcription factor n=1 Tax=Bacillus pseudomycoides TaxID=64104 RepID=UPI003D649247
MLIVEDEENIREVCKRYLEREEYEVYTAVSGIEGWDLFLTYQPDLIILDLMMSKKDVWELCEERDRILGLTMGADDYVTKPFSPRELVLRVQTILKRNNPIPIQVKESLSEAIEFPDLKIYPKTRCVLVCKNKVGLTAKEFEVLYLMAKHPKQVLSRSQLLELIWNTEHEVITNIVTVLVSRLRDKLEKHTTKNRWIHTVWGIGYRFEPNGGSET